MKTLILMRHAKAVQGDFAVPDLDRTLTDRGKADAMEMGKRLHKKEIKPDILISSPANRAHKTAKIIAKELDYNEKDIDLQFDIYSADIEELVHIIRGIDDNHKTGMLFGHNPTFTSIIGYLSDTMLGHLPTAGAVSINFEADTWKQISTG